MTPLSQLPIAAVPQYEHLLNAIALPKAETTQLSLDEHVQEMMQWHFSEASGTPYWLGRKASLGFDPLKDVKTFDDLSRLFPPFDGDVLKEKTMDHLIPRGFGDRPYMTTQTGGTSGGLPSRRPTWVDYMIDYSEFSETVEERHFPQGARWLNAGPSGPRRLPLAINYLSQIRGGTSAAIDCDPVIIKKLQGKGMDDAVDFTVDHHIIPQILVNLKTGAYSAMFTSPPLLQEVALKVNLYECGIRGVFFGGTEISPEWMRLMMELVGPNVGLYPTYGNTLMGLAKHAPVVPENNYAVTYYAPQPRAVLTVVNPKNTTELVEYGQWGQIRLTTMTREFFMPNYLERDEAIRRPGCAKYPWDGVEFVRPLGSGEGKKTKVGVY